jgi:DNA repair photolyase
MSRDRAFVSPPRLRKGRGALSNPAGRFEPYHYDPLPEDLAEAAAEDGTPPRLATRIYVDQARTIIAHNRSPDIPFEQSINPYRGCEHGCVYCYARPSHGYLGLSSGLDFESVLFAKPEAAARLVTELSRPGYRVRPIAFGTNTDPYQPVERRLRITRALIEVLAACAHPLTIVTKGALIERDLDLLAPMAAERLVGVHISLTTLDPALARRLEPRAASPARRLEVIEKLAAAGVPVGVMFAPVIPALNDDEMEAVLAAAAARGARFAGWVLLRLPHEVSALFEEWLAAHYPLKRAHVLALLRSARGGRLNDPRFGTRLRGQGEYARLLDERFRLACRRLGLNREVLELDVTRFRPPPRPLRASGQLELFG